MKSAISLGIYMIVALSLFTYANVYPGLDLALAFILILFSVALMMLSGIIMTLCKGATKEMKNLDNDYLSRLGKVSKQFTKKHRILLSIVSHSLVIGALFYSHWFYILTFYCIGVIGVFISFISLSNMREKLMMVRLTTNKSS